MKLIYCKSCKDVVRIIPNKWRMCECKKSGGQYIDCDDNILPIATVGGECDVIGIPNPFFDEVFKHLSEPHGKQWFRNEKGYGGNNTSDCWYGEFPGDKQVFRIKSPKGPQVKCEIEKIKDKNNPYLVKVKIVDNREVTVVGEKLESVIIETDFKPSFSNSKGIVAKLVKKIIKK